MVASPNKPEARQAITLVVLLANGVDREVCMEEAGGLKGSVERGGCGTSGGSTHEAWGELAAKQGTICSTMVCCQRVLEHTSMCPTRDALRRH